MKALEFRGNGKEYFKIWIVNILLILITVGLYYPWAKVRNNRYFHGNTNFDKRSFDYHATGKQLFLGFILSIIFLVVYVAVSELLPELSLILLGVLLIAIPWIIWRSMQFNMRMTSFSNVRFGFVGGLKGSYINFLLYPVLTLLFIYIIPVTLALAPLLLMGTFFEYMDIYSMLMPYLMVLSFFIGIYLYFKMKQKNLTYLLNSSRYGQGEFNTELKISKFIIIFLQTSLVAIIVMTLAIGIYTGVIYSIFGLDYLQNIMENIKDPMYIESHLMEIIPLFVGFYLVLIVAMIFVLAFAITRQRTYIFANTTLDKEIAFQSTLAARPFLWVLLSNFFIIIVTLGLAIPWAKVRMARLMLEHTQVDTSIGIEQYISQKQTEASALAEQIGDAFDVDVGIGL